MSGLAAGRPASQPGISISLNVALGVAPRCPPDVAPVALRCCPLNVALPAQNCAEIAYICSLLLVCWHIVLRGAILKISYADSSNNSMKKPHNF